MILFLSALRHSPGAEKGGRIKLPFDRHPEDRGALGLCDQIKWSTFGDDFAGAQEDHSIAKRLSFVDVVGG